MEEAMNNVTDTLQVGMVCTTIAIVAIVLAAIYALHKQGYLGTLLAMLVQGTFYIVSAALGVVTVLGGLYIVSPADILPDVIPVLGQVDDAAALVTALLTGTASIISAILGSIVGSIGISSGMQNRKKRLPPSSQPS